MSNPTLRFKSANGLNFPDTVSCTLSDISKYSKGTIERKNCLFIGNEQLVSNFGGATLEFRTEAKGTEFNSGDILFGNIRPYLKKVWLSDQSGIASPDVLIFKVTDSIPGYLKCILSSERFFNHVAQGYKGSKMPRGDKHQIMDFRIQCPCLEEQQKIASFFSTLDQKIELNERKLEALEKLKKGLLRKIFDHEIRFKSDDGGTYSNWNESSLGNYFSVKMCKRIFKEETSDIGEVPFFKIGTFGKTPDAYISKELFEKYRKNFNYPSINDTLISCSGTVGRCVLFDGKASYFQDSNIVWLEPIDKNLIYNKIYLYIVLSNLSWHELSSTTIKRIYSKNLLSKKWPIPCIEEQNKIASLFVLLDKKITLFSQRLQSLKKLKKGFMQQMFV